MKKVSVRLIISDDKGRVLFIKRAQTSHGCNLWCLPGGKMDAPESASAAASRELYEECHLVCSRCKFFSYEKYPSESPGWIELYFKCHATGKINLNGEASDYRWLHPLELDNYPCAFGHDQTVLRYWRMRGS